MASKDQKSTSDSLSPAILYRDPISFQTPLDEALAACTAVLTRAVPKVAGAEATLRAAIDEYKALETFITSVETHIQKASFNDLPVVRKWWRPMPGLHQLNCGPFRGVFLIGRDPSRVTALLFSCKPHDVSKRLPELVASHRANAQENAGEDT